MRLLLLCCLCGVGLTQPGRVRVMVQLVGVRGEKGGTIHVGLHAAPGTGFPGPSALTNTDVAPGGDLRVTFEVAPGDYAVAVHHDANSNGRMEANFIGIPKEGYAVSNNVRPRFRAPRFTEARVTVTRDTALVVRLVY